MRAIRHDALRHARVHSRDGEMFILHPGRFCWRPARPVRAIVGVSLTISRGDAFTWRLPLLFPRHEARFRKHDRNALRLLQAAL